MAENWRDVLSTFSALFGYQSFSINSSQLIHNLPSNPRNCGLFRLISTMANSPTMLFRGQKSLNNRNIDLLFVEHDASHVIEIIGTEVLSTADATAPSTDRIYVAADKLYTAVTTNELRKHTAESSSGSSSGSGASTEMTPKDLRNVAVQLLIDALSLAPSSNGDSSQPISLQLSAISFGMPASGDNSSSSSSSDATTTDEVQVHVRLEGKPDRLEPFPLPAAGAMSSSAGAATVAGVLAGLAQDGAQIDSIGASMLDISNKMTDTAASLTMGFQEDILAAFDADVLQDAVQTIIDDATIRRPRRGGPGGETMAALQSQHNKEAAALAQSVP